MKYIFLFLCYILMLKIQGHGQLAITFCVQSCENAFLREPVLPLFCYFSFFMTLIARTCQSFILIIKEMQGVRSPKSVYAWIKQVKFNVLPSKKKVSAYHTYYVLISPHYC